MKVPHLYDSINFISKSSYPKALNFFQLWSSFRRSRRLGLPEISGFPASIAIEPTTSCNLRCPECPSGLRSFTRATGSLDPGLFRKVADELKEHLVNLTFYFQGEPYLNPHFLDMVEHASDNNIYTMTSTNAHYLHKDEKVKQTVRSGLSRIIISIDGITQASYQDYRVGGKLDRVIEGTKNLVSWKKKLRSMTPHIVWQFLVSGKNEHEIGALHQLAKSLGVNEVKLKSIQVYDFEHGSPLIPQNEKYSRYRKLKNGKYEIKNKLEDHCWKMWHSAVITWDGNVLPCCFDKDGQYVMGNVTETSFEDIWYGDTYQNFRKTLLKGRKEIDICRNCSEGTPVWV